MTFSASEMARELATARLSVASYLHRQEPLAAWLAIETRAGGLRGKAAMLAVTEALRDHPTRACELNELIAPRGGRAASRRRAAVGLGS